MTVNVSSSSGETLHSLLKFQEFYKNEKPELFSVYVGTLSEESKVYTLLGHKQSKTSDHLYQFDRSGQQSAHITATEKKINKGNVKVFFFSSFIFAF